MIGPRRHAATALAALPVVGLLAGCDKQQNALAPESHASKDIASLFWWMMGGAWLGLGLVVALLLFAWARRQRKPSERTSWIVVLTLGIAVPIVVMAAIFVVGDLFVIRTTQAPAAGSTRLTIRVIGHQWWWEVRYPGTNVVTANELHIPARTPVRIEVRTADVIHSFWVPRLNRTIDAIPGRTNSIALEADTPGRYRGQCDEFCGLQHAHMAFYVFADPPARFRRWLAAQERPPARTPPTLFDTAGCADCHTIRGTQAQGDTGPDLTHVGSRTTLGALAIPNDRGHLAEWIRDSQHAKPGNAMPPFRLSNAQLDALATYLEGLE